MNTLIELDETLALNDPDSTRWQSVLERLTPLPINEHGLMITPDEGYNFSHRHYSHLLSLYPLHTINPDQGPEAEALFRSSVDRWQSLDSALASYSYTGAASMYATLGEGDRALDKLDGMLEVGVGPALAKIAKGEKDREPKKVGVLWNTMYAEGGGPVIETPLSVVESMGYLLIQSWGDCLRVFPAVPARWPDVVFHDLRAEGAFLVSAERKEGATQWIRIQSLAGEPLVLETDMTQIKAVGETHPILESFVGPRGQTRWRVDLKKGESVLLEPDSKKQ